MGIKRAAPLLLIIICASILAADLISCGGSTTRVGHPVWGVTRRFPVPAVGRDAKASPYDFTRLKDDIGLYVFSYEIVFQGPSREKPVTYEGLRVWEHDFKVDHSDRPYWMPDTEYEIPDTVLIVGLIPVARRFEGALEEESKKLDPEDRRKYIWEQSWLISQVPGSIYLSIADNLASIFSGHGGPLFNMRFIKGEVVYGGHVEVNAVSDSVLMSVTDMYVEDVEPIIARFGDQMDRIKISTDLMTLVPPPIDSTLLKPAELDRPTRIGL